jgi:adenosylcobinamide-GDP ribazoletransferase
MPLLDLNLETLPRDVMRALGFLTRLPVAAKWFEGDEGTLSQTCRAFPIAGALSTLPSTLALAVGTVLDLPVLLTAAFSTAVLMIVCGVLHEDGLADVADGFYGGGTAERRLEIMKDSRIGAYGASALILALVLRTIALASLLQTGLYSAAAGLIAAVVAGKTALIWHWTELPSARADGTADKAGAPGEDASVFALVSGAVITLVLALAFRGISPTVIAAAFAALAAIGFRTLCQDKISGHTGDTLGAAALIAEIAFLTGLASGL